MKMNVMFNDRQTALLGRMADEMGTTRAGVLKTALAILDIVIRERRDGNEPAIIRGDAIVRRIEGLWPDPPPKNDLPANAVVMLRAEDGSLHEEAAAAARRDRENRTIAGILACLWMEPSDESDLVRNGEDFVSHDPAVVQHVRGELAKLCRPYASTWFAERDDEPLFDPGLVPPEYLMRVMTGAPPALEKALNRMTRIDRKGREWSQPFFAIRANQQDEANREAIEALEETINPK